MPSRISSGVRTAEEAVLAAQLSREAFGTNWLKLEIHPEIKVVTRDGSQSYASIISTASELIMQVSDRFHLMQALKRDAVEQIRLLLGQKNARRQYPYPTEEEAYKG